MHFKRKQGFSLIELLIGLSIFSVVAVSLYTTFWQGVKISQRSANVNYLYREIRWAVDRMSMELENMVYYNFEESYPEIVALNGKSDQITFLFPSTSGLKAVSYYLQDPQKSIIHKTLVGKKTKKLKKIVTRIEQSAEVKYLVRDEQDMIHFINKRNKTNDGNDIDTLSIHLKNSGLSFEYGAISEELQRVQSVPEMTWYDEWQKNFLPIAIRVKLTFIDSAQEGGVLNILKEIKLTSSKIDS